MKAFEVVLGIDRVARDTMRRMTVSVLATDRLSAALSAEEAGDKTVDQNFEYTRTIDVREIKPRPVCAAALAVA
jgi:hypothetical protein